MVEKSPRQGSVAKFERDFCSGVNGYRLKEEEEGGASGCSTLLQ